MRKPPFPIWNIITILMISLFIIGFYLNGKLNLNFTWNDNWVEVILCVMVFFWSCLNAGIECNKINEFIKFKKEMQVDRHQNLYEYLRNYLIKYKDSEKPRLDVFKNTLVIRLAKLSTNRPIEVITEELTKTFSENDKERMIELNMLIDYWLEEFVKEEDEKLKKLLMNEVKRTGFAVVAQTTEVSDRVQFDVISYLLTNVCHENVNNETNLLERF